MALTLCRSIKFKRKINDSITYLRDIRTGSQLQPINLLLTLPQQGALQGLWAADTYDVETKSVKNLTAESAPISRNIFRASRRMFSNIAWWSNSSGTITDDAASDPNGLMEASTAVMTGNWSIFCPLSSYSLPKGTYTAAIYAKRNTGSDQKFSFSFDNGVTRSSANTATASWQRFAYTFTINGITSVNNILLCSIDGSTNANLQICDLELYTGSADLGPAVLNGHLYVGGILYDTRPSYSSGALDLSSTAYGIIQFPNTLSIGNFTAQAVVSKVVSGAPNQAFISKIQNYLDFSGMTAQTNIPVTANNSNTFGGVGQEAGLWTLLNKGYHLLTHRWDGSAQQLWLDDIPLFSTPATMSSFAVRDLFCNLVDVTGAWAGLKYVGVGLWNVALSDAEITKSFSVWRSRASFSSITLSGGTTDRIYAAEGDSISGANGNCYPFVFGPNSSPSIFGINFAISGSHLSDLVARAHNADAILLATFNGRKFILSVLIGANDLASYAGATDAIAAANYTSDLAGYCDARRAAGWLVVVCTILPVFGDAVHNARRVIVNSNIRATWVGLHCDGIADFGGDAIMGTDTSFTDNPSDWSNERHPSQAGQIILESIIRPIINGM